MLIDIRKDLVQLNTILPVYKCHKLVKAMRIEAITSIGEVADVTLTLVDEHTSSHQVIVPESWYLKHKPMLGGYFVLYEDDYYSYSPADAFTSGYHRHML